MKLVILAGGKGTRLGLEGIPKPMVQLAGKPLLEHQILLAKHNGIREIYLLTGYRASVIRDYFGNGSRFGVSITHIVETNPLGTAGSVKQLRDIIKERFLLFYGDLLLDMDLHAFINFDQGEESLASLVVHPNDHPYDSDLVAIDSNNNIIDFHSKPHSEGIYYRNLVNAAVYILGPAIFSSIPDDCACDFGKDIFPALVRSGEKLRAYQTAEYIKDIGTVERLERGTNDLLSGKVARWSKQYKRPAIFMDRDGTLIEEVDLLHKPQDLILFPFSSAAIRRINRSDYLGILVTNQPVVARNLCDITRVHHIHDKLTFLLGKEGAYLDNIYFCPHHPDKGFPGENSKYKIDCNCRKPRIGMITRAAEEYNVDTSQSWFIGDRSIDVQTGINAGLRTILVRTGIGGKDGKSACVPDYVFDTLEEAVNFITEKK